MKSHKCVRLSVVIPVFNEQSTIKEIISRVRRVKIAGVKIEIIVVNDGSTDKTRKILEKLKFKNLRVLNLLRNQGKGEAIKQGLKKGKGDIFVIQDADLEYDPVDYIKLIAPILDKKADVVYGSRFIGGAPHRVLYFWHSVGNNFLTFISNALTNLNLTDMETCYKMFTKEVAKKLNLQEKRFGLEPEFTAKIAKMNCRVYEVGVSYAGRSYEEGKKIGWKDGVRTLWCILRYNF